MLYRFRRFKDVDVCSKTSTLRVAVARRAVFMKSETRRQERRVEKILRIANVAIYYFNLFTDCLYKVSNKFT